MRILTCINEVAELNANSQAISRNNLLDLIQSRHLFTLCSVLYILFINITVISLCIDIITSGSLGVDNEEQNVLLRIAKSYNL